MMKQLQKREEGFTLVELLIAIVILGIVMSGLATGFITTIRGTKDLHERFLESQDAQLLATYFPSDVQSANPTMIDTSASPADECNGVTGTNVVRMRWTQIEGTALTAFSASYRLTTTPDGGVLTRWFCSGPGSATDTPGNILKTLAATPKTVARNLATTIPSVNVGANSVDMTLASFKTGYTFKFTGTTRTPGAWLALEIGGPSPANPTAGNDVTFQLTAKNAAGGTDTTFDGAKTFTVSGFLASPNGTTPLSTVIGNFTAGVGSVTLKLYRAAATSLTFTSGVYRGSTTSSVNVNAGPYAPGNLIFSACPPNPKVGQSTSMQVLRTMTDAYGNTATTAPAITVNLADTTGGATVPSAVPIAANTASGSFTVTNPTTPGTTVTLTASLSGYASDTCSYKTNNAKFLVSTAASPVAGTSFNVTITATTDGTTTDTTYDGLKTLTFSGPGNAPNGTAPAYPANVTFSGGVATVPITLYKAETGVTLTVSDGSQSGTLPVSVAAGPMSLQFSSCPATLKKNTSFTSTILRQDSWGNVSGSDTAVTVSASAGDFGGSKTAPQTSVTVTVPGGSSASPSFTYNAPSSNGTSVSLTAAASGFTTVTCAFTTTN